MNAFSLLIILECIIEDDDISPSIISFYDTAKKSYNEKNMDKDTFALERVIELRKI